MRLTAENAKEGAREKRKESLATFAALGATFAVIPSARNLMRAL
jgi:hypothetical protein